MFSLLDEPNGHALLTLNNREEDEKDESLLFFLSLLFLAVEGGAIWHAFRELVLDVNNSFNGDEVGLDDDDDDDFVDDFLEES